MKKLFSTLCMAGATLGLAACDTTGEGPGDTAPYTMERTAGSTPNYSTSREAQTGGETREVESAEPVFDDKMRK